MFEIFLRLRVAFHQTDKAGIIHFTNLFKYVEEAEASFFRALDLGPLDLVWGAGRNGLGWVRLKAELEFLGPARLDDLLLVHLWISEKRSRTLGFGTRISLREKIVAQGRIKTMSVRMTGDGYSACLIPAEIAEAVEVAPWGQGWPED